MSSDPRYDFNRLGRLPSVPIFNGPQVRSGRRYLSYVHLLHSHLSLSLSFFFRKRREIVDDFSSIRIWLSYPQHWIICYNPFDNICRMFIYYTHISLSLSHFFSKTSQNRRRFFVDRIWLSYPRHWIICYNPFIIKGISQKISRTGTRAAWYVRRKSRFF